MNWNSCQIKIRDYVDNILLSLFHFQENIFCWARSELLLCDGSQHTIELLWTNSMSSVSLCDKTGLKPVEPVWLVEDHHSTWRVIGCTLLSGQFVIHQSLNDFICL